VIVYGDYECPFCAALETRLACVGLRVAFRHFPVRSSHPRAFPAACAAEAAGRQDAFWPMHDALFGDQARLEDPHLWARAERLGLDVERFEADRRSPAAATRVTADFRGGLRAGVPTTPSLFLEGRLFAGRPDDALWERLRALAAG
jgi:protein-disulfide isomerase